MALSTVAVAGRLVFCAQSAHQIHDEADQKDQPETAATDGRAAKIKAAATEQKNKKEDEKDWIHASKISSRGEYGYGALPHHTVWGCGHWFHAARTVGTFRAVGRLGLCNRPR